jgi:hypothetical protein
MVSNSLLKLFLNPMWMIPLAAPSSWPISAIRAYGSTGSLYRKSSCQRWSGGVSCWAAATTVQYEWRKLPFEGERIHKVWMDSHLRGRLLWQVWVKSLTLLRNVEVEHFISEMTHKLNTLKFWVKVWCPTHLLKLFLNSMRIIPLAAPSS